MGTSRAARADGRSLEAGGQERAGRPAGPDRPSALAALQGSAGNWATTALVQQLRRSTPGSLPPGLARSAGTPLRGALLAQMERRFDVDLGDVDVHQDAQAARSADLLGATAYAWGTRVVLGADAPALGTAAGRELLAHEVTHVLQQATPGSAAPAAAEAGAHAAVRGFGSAEPVPVGAGTGGPALLRIPRTIEEEVSLDPRSLGYSELVTEIHEIDKWLADNPVSSVENDQLIEARADLAAEKARRDRDVAKGGARGRRGKARAATPPKPRALSESYDPSTWSPEEVAAELDAVVAYLAARPTRAERRQLAPVLAELRKAAGVNLARSDEAERQQRIVDAFTPRVTGNEGEALRAVMRTVEAMTPASDRPGVWYAFYEGRTIPLLPEEVERIRDAVRQNLTRAEGRLRRDAEAAKYHYELQQEINEDSEVVSSIVQFFSDVDDPGEAFVMSQAKVAGKLAVNVRKLLAEGRFVDAAGQLIALDIATSSLKARVTAWVDGLIDTAELTVKVLETTRDVSFAISISIGATLAAPALLAGGAGVIGTGAIVTGGGAVAGATLRGGSNLAGQALAGGEINAGEAFAEAKAGAKAGAFDAATAAATVGARGLLGVERATSLVGRTGRAVVAEGAVGGVSETGRALAEGKSIGEALERGRTGLVSSSFGAAGGEVVRPIVGQSRARQVVAGGLVGGGASTLAAYASGDPNLRQAALIGTVAGTLPAAASRQLPAARTGGGATQPPPGPTRIVGEPVVVHKPSGLVIKSEADLRAAEVRRSSPGALVVTDRYGNVQRNRPAIPAGKPAGLVNPAQQRVYERGRLIGRPLPRTDTPALVRPGEPPTPPAGAAGPQILTADTPPRAAGAAPPQLLGPDERPLGAPSERRTGYVAGPTEAPTQAVAGATLDLAAPLDLPLPLPAGPTARGGVVQHAVIRRSYPGPDAVPLPWSFPAVDVVVGGKVTQGFAGQRRGAVRRTVRVEGGTAISIKSVDVDAVSYKTADSTLESLQGYVDDVVNYGKGNVSLSQQVGGQLVQYTVVNPTGRALHLELTGPPTREQMDGFARLRNYAADHDVQLILVTSR